MDINGWLTVITVFTAIFALLPKENRKLTEMMIPKLEKYCFILIFIIIIPYLIIFPKLLYRFSFLKMFCFSNGFESGNIAFGLFYLSFLWLILNIYKPHNNKHSKETVELFIEILNEKYFDEFFKIFSKYTSSQNIIDNWNLFQAIILHPKFLNNIVVKNPSYILPFWNKFSNEEDFRNVFRSYLENENSGYYLEIKGHWNSYSLLNNKQFLEIVLHENIKQSIDNGLIIIFSDFTTKHLRGEHGKQSIYNQKHFSPRIREDEGFDLPAFHHITFIGLLYETVIQDKIDISASPNKYTNMQSIYSGMINEMINNIIPIEINQSGEIQTNYHWLITRIFSLSNNWLKTFNDEDYFEPNSSYIHFIPNSISLCLDELYSGNKKGKISEDFIIKEISFSILFDYFKDSLNDKLKTEIENYIISKIPKKFKKQIFDYVLNKDFAIDYDQLIKENYGRTPNNDRKSLIRFRDFNNKN